MAASHISPDQFASICKRCECLKLEGITPDTLFPRNLQAGERSREQEVDLDWKVTNFMVYAFHLTGEKCDSCEFIRRAMQWWQVYDESVRKFIMKWVPLSLHYVFALDEADQYGLKALRIRIRPDDKEFHIDCPIAAATDLDIGTSLRLQPPLSLINEENLLWMKSKLESCLLHNHFNPDKTFIPDRLIDVRENQLSLLLTKELHPADAESHRYIALTYCWGPEPHASKQLKTTSVNISQHQQQIPESSLPQVIKDAVAVSRALSIPFLWVDALCILQDDLSDWINQYAVMERIYGNAYTAVAATCSHNCEEGFIRRKDRILLPSRTKSYDTHVFGIYSPPSLPDATQESYINPWLQRGWTFQERIASTRILMFSSEKIRFKCKYFSESMGMERHTKEDYYIMLDRMTIESGSTAAMYREWSKTVAQINPQYHKLTRETDFFPSIAGIASLFGRRLNDEYAAGIWKNSMHQSLCWVSSKMGDTNYQHLLKRLKAPSPYIAPSWSWANQRGYFSFDLYLPYLSADCRPEFHGLDTAIVLGGESVFGELRDAALNIKSKVYVGSPKLTLHQKTGQIQGDTVRLDGRYFADIQTDCFGQDIFESAESRSLATPISFLLICSTIRRETEVGDFSSKGSGNPEALSNDTNAGINSGSLSASTVSAASAGDLENETICKRVAYGLLIHPTEHSNEYYRVGMFYSNPEFGGGLSVFNSVEVRTIRLV